jgi:hypothetical protein
MFRHLLHISALAALFWVPVAAHADDATQERLRQIRQTASERAAEDAALRLPGAGQKRFEFGGWFSFTFLNINEDDRDRTATDTTHGLTIKDLRLWTAADLTERVKTYIRIRHLEIDFNTFPGVTPTDTRSQEGVQLDLAYLD